MYAATLWNPPLLRFFPVLRLGAHTTAFREVVTR